MKKIKLFNIYIYIKHLLRILHNICNKIITYTYILCIRKALIYFISSLYIYFK